MRAYLILFLGVAVVAAASQPPVILISIDTLRADHLSAYGYTKIQTLNIDAFAEHGTVFKAIDSQIPLTLPSHTCLFTSTYPFENGVEENAEIVPERLLTLATVLQQHGYRTGAFIGSDLLSQRFRLNRGFDVYDSPFHPDAGQLQSPYDVRVRRDGALVVRSATQWLNTPSDKPPFVFLHLFDLHAPYKAVPSSDSLPNTNGYDTEIEYVDRVLGRFRKMLVDRGWWDRAVVILLSDHGESLGEHGEISHGYFIYQSTLWVPLIIHWPTGVPPLPDSVNVTGGLIDVAPTILDFLHYDKPAAFHGSSLLASAKSRKVYSETMYEHDAFRWSALRSLRIGNFQYIDAPSAELYDLKSDPLEQRNVIEAHIMQTQELRSSLRSLLAGSTSRQSPVEHDASDTTQTTLRSLGYVAAAPRVSVNTSGPDPKSKLAEYQAYERGLEALYDHREFQAVSVFRTLLQHDPTNTVARYYLGEAYLRLQRRDDAIREWKTALNQDPTYLPAAEALQKLGRR